MSYVLITLALMQGSPKWIERLPTRDLQQCMEMQNQTQMLTQYCPLDAGNNPAGAMSATMKK